MILSGWLLDVCEDPVDGTAVWLLADDERRLRLRQHFPAALCVRGEEQALLVLQKHLGERFPQLVFRREERHDVFARREVEVLAVEAPRVGDLPAVLRAASRAFPRLEYADADLPLSLRYAARTGLFPLARCRLEVGPGSWIQAAEPLDSPWDLEHIPAPLRVLELAADSGYGPAKKLIARAGGQTQVFSLEPARALLVGLRSPRRYLADAAAARPGGALRHQPAAQPRQACAHRAAQGTLVLLLRAAGLPRRTGLAERALAHRPPQRHAVG
jgi:hypothetical protein